MIFSPQVFFFCCNMNVLFGGPLNFISRFLFRLSKFHYYFQKTLFLFKLFKNFIFTPLPYSLLHGAFNLIPVLPRNMNHSDSPWKFIFFILLLLLFMIKLKFQREKSMKMFSFAFYFFYYSSQNEDFQGKIDEKIRVVLKQVCQNVPRILITSARRESFSKSY